MAGFSLKTPVEGGVREVETLLAASRKAYKSKPEVLVVPLVRFWGNLAAGGEHSTGAVVGAGIVPTLLHPASTDEHYQAEVCWILSNVAAGTPVQLHALIDAAVVDHLLQGLEREHTLTVFKEVLWVFANICKASLRTNKT